MPHKLKLQAEELQATSKIDYAEKMLESEQHPHISNLLAACSL
jgi:hypothetical protein